jgi:hypothetical protein
VGARPAGPPAGAPGRRRAAWRSRGSSNLKEALGGPLLMVIPGRRGRLVAPVWLSLPRRTVAVAVVFTGWEPIPWLSHLLLLTP